MTFLQISDVAAKHLDTWLDQTTRGELQLWQLPAPVAAFYYAGWADGIAEAKRQARDYEHQLDRMYLAVMNPKDRAAVLQRRLDEHFANECDRFFAEPQIEGPAPLLERRAA